MRSPPRLLHPSHPLSPSDGELGLGDLARFRPIELSPGELTWKLMVKISFVTLNLINYSDSLVELTFSIFFSLNNFV